MNTLHLLGIYRVTARFGSAGPANNWVNVNFPGSDAATTEITLFFNENEAAARAYANAINAVPFKAPIDEQEAA